MVTPIQPLNLTHNFNGDTSAANKLDAGELDTQLVNVVNKINEILARYNAYGVPSSAIGWINIKEYGAIGGGADDTAAIQAAYAAAAARAVAGDLSLNGSGLAGVGIVYVPRGKYRCVGDTNLITNPASGVVSYGIITIGDGLDASQILWEPTSGAERILFDFNNLSYARVIFRGVGFKVNNSHTQAIAIRLAASSNGPQNGSVEFCGFYNFSSSIATDGTDLNSEFLIDHNYFAGLRNQAAIYIRGTDQCLNWWIDNNSFIAESGSFLTARKGGSLHIGGGNIFNSADTATSGTACGYPIWCDGDTAAGAYPQIKTALGSYAGHSGMVIRWADQQTFTTNASASFTSSAAVAQPTAATLTYELRDKTPGIIYPAVILHAAASPGDTTVALKLATVVELKTINRGDRLMFAGDQNVYIVQADAVLDATGVLGAAVSILPAVITGGAINAVCHLSPPYMFEYLGFTHARGVTCAAIDRVRLEHRGPHSRFIRCQWPNGSLSVTNCDDSVQTTSVGPMHTMMFEVLNNSGPRVRFSNCVFHGWPEIFYGNNAYRSPMSMRFSQCMWRIGADYNVGFACVPKDLVTSSAHTEYGSAPTITLDDCMGDVSLSTNDHVRYGELNALKGERGAVRAMWHSFKSTKGLSPITSEVHYVYLPPNAIITRLRLRLAPGVAPAIAGCTYVITTSDGTTHATAAPATLDLGFDIDVKPTNGAFVCNTAARRKVILTTNANVPGTGYADFFALVEYIGG